VGEVLEDLKMQTKTVDQMLTEMVVNGCPKDWIAKAEILADMNDSGYLGDTLCLECLEAMQNVCLGR
jgi:hypothetical protein